MPIWWKFSETDLFGISIERTSMFSFITSFVMTCKFGIKMWDQLIWILYSHNILDVDECLNKPCDVNATCNNTVGSFICKCISGYTGNGRTCSGESNFSDFAQYLKIIWEINFFFAIPFITIRHIAVVFLVIKLN